MWKHILCFTMILSLFDVFDRWDMEKSRLKFPPAVLHVEVVPFFYGKKSENLCALHAYKYAYKDIHEITQWGVSDMRRNLYVPICSV